MNNNTITSAVAEIAAAQAKGSRFASLTYRAKGTGELARFTVLLGADLEKAYRRDLAIIRKRISRNTDPLRGQALAEIECSLAESLKVGIGNNSRYTKKETYVQVVPGIKVAKETGEL